MTPSTVWAVMASSDDSTMLARRARVSSARLRSVMSRMAAVRRTPASVGSYSWGGIFNTFFWADPEKQLAGVLMTQVYPSGHPSLRGDFQKLAYEALGE